MRFWLANGGGAARNALPCDAPLVRRLRNPTSWRGRAAQTRDGSPPPCAAAEGIGHQTLEAVALVVRRRSIHKCSGVSAAQPDGDFLDLNAADSKNTLLLVSKISGYFN